MAGALIVQGYTYYQNDRNIQSPVAQVGEISTAGLDSPINATQTPTGKIYFSAVFASTSQSEAMPYTYIVAQNRFDLLMEQNFTSMAPYATTSLIGVTSLDQFGATNSYQPYLVNLQTKEFSDLPNISGHMVTDLSVSPNGTYYAYSYQTEVGVSAKEPQLLEHWHVAIHDFSSENVIVLDGGNQPEWIHNGTQLLYVTESGLMLYDIASGTSQLIFETYAPLNAADDIAVAPDSSKVIFTKPNLNMIAVLDYKQESGNPVVIERGRLISDDTTYYNPVVSPDSKFYVTNAEKMNNFKLNSEDMSYTYSNSYALEIRQIDNAKVITSVPLSEVATSSVSISSWASQ
ncbi:MAG: hypothetical protein V4668_04615 [Patescibacteria group bacterium]